ncbi:MAG: AAA family ATPase [Cyanophyceae cyanobacterium]
MTWKHFHGNCGDTPNPLVEIPDRPPWREFLPREQVDEKKDNKRWDKLHERAKEENRAIERGKSFRIQKDKNGDSEIVDAVNAALHLRRPLLITGVPGSGKTSLAYAVAYELQLGPVLVWPVTARATLKDALYRYDAIARLQDAQLDQTRSETTTSQVLELMARQRGSQLDQTDSEAIVQLESQEKPSREERSLGDYIQLGPVGTAFLSSRRPRVLLIDEIDKSDLNLPNDLLNLFEEGQFEIPELVRRKRIERQVTVLTEDKDLSATITEGRIECCEFPFVVMTSNGERDFPPAFRRRCLRVRMPDPTLESLYPIIESRFGEDNWKTLKPQLEPLIKKFLEGGNKADRATDQLLNAVYLITRDPGPSEMEMEKLRQLLFKRLSEAD